MMHPSQMDRLSNSSFHPAIFKATTAQGIIVSAQTQYPSVA